MAKHNPISTLYKQEFSSVNAHHLFRNEFPKGSRLRKGFFGSIVRAFPGMIPSTSPYMRAVKQSVVGSGPTLLPRKSCSMRYLETHMVQTSTVISLCLKHGKLMHADPFFPFFFLMIQVLSLPDKSSLSCWVLTHHQHHRFVVKVCVLIAWWVKVMERIVFFYWQQPLVIKILQLLCHHVDVPHCFRGAPKPPEGHGDSSFTLNFSVWKLLALLRPN